MKKFVYAIFCFFTLISLTACNSDNSTAYDDLKIPERYIEAVEGIKNDLKDPTSMRIYGDIVVANLEEKNATVISVVYDAKNAYGAFSGKTITNIYLTPDNDPAYVSEENAEYYIDIRELYNKQSKYTEEELSEMRENGTLSATVNYEIFSGEEMAKALDNVEYYKN